MTLKPCLTCGALTEGARCQLHTDTSRPSRARGYDTRWDKLSRRARQLQPWCTDCGRTDDLQLDHLPGAWERVAAHLPLRLGADVEVVCGPCNRARGAARGDQPRGVGVKPLAREPHSRESFGQNTPRGYIWQA
ncbi:hypothetical protein GCM10009785_33620 [Brooklawnia cerclae]